MAARVSDARDSMGSSASAGKNPEHGTGQLANGSRTVVPSVVQKVSDPAKNTRAFDWNWGAAGTCENVGCIIHRLRRFHRLESNKELATKRHRRHKKESSI